jgi:hypothetical protein
VAVVASQGAGQGGALGGECQCGDTAGLNCSVAAGGPGDGLSCTADERCTAEAGLCVGTTLDHASCADDGNPCTTARCDPGGPPPTGCVHDQVSCDDGDPCTTDTCDSATGDCVRTPRDCTCRTDSDCDIDNNSCNGNERCFECPLCEVTDRFACCSRPGTCSSGPVPPPASACDDNDACTVNDQCDTQRRCIGVGIPGNPVESVGCLLDQTPCPENPAPRKLLRLRDRAGGFVERAAGDTPRRGPIRKALRRLARARAVARKAGRTGKLPADCSALWVTFIDDARSRLRTVLDGA